MNDRKARHERDAYAKSIGSTPGKCYVCGRSVLSVWADEWCEECGDALFDDDDEQGTDNQQHEREHHVYRTA